MRYFLGVHIFAATAAIQGDMAWIPLRFRRYMNILRFWNHLVKMDNSRLVKRTIMTTLMETGVPMSIRLLN